MALEDVFDLFAIKGMARFARNQTIDMCISGFMQTKKLYSI